MSVADVAHVADYGGTGAAALDAAEVFIRRFCVLPGEHAYVAVTLWAAHTHLIGKLETTGRLAALSPEPGSGKTRVLEVLDVLCASPLLALDLSMSAFFRIVEARQPTILLDEVDAIFTGKSKSEGAEDLRRTINNGYRKGAVVQRVGGKDRDEVQDFHVFTPVAMAGLGNLPDTLMSRSIVLKMKRRAPGEQVEPWRDRLHRPVGLGVAEQLAEWAGTLDDLDYPALPDGVHDRDADVWEPLLMAADAAGGAWPARARAACSVFVADKPESTVSLGVRLLADLRTIWPENRPVMATADILAELAKLDESPWADLYGEGLKPRKLASMLADYDARPGDVRTEHGTLKGYRREDLWDAWQRYLPPRPLEKRDIRDKGDIPSQSVADRAEETATTPPVVADVAHVADVALSQNTEATPPRRRTRAQPAAPCPDCGNDLHTEPGMLTRCRPNHRQEALL